MKLDLAAEDPVPIKQFAARPFTVVLASAEFSELPPPKILLVDDEPDNLLALGAVLQDLGPEIVTATSGTDALRQLLDQDFGVILLDVKMPNMDGFETATLIRKRERSRTTPIIFLTGYRNEDSLFRGYDVGAADYLFKPVVPEVLRSKVTVFIELSRKTELLRRHAAVLERKNDELHALALEREVARAELHNANQRLQTLNQELAERAQRIARQAEDLVRSNAELEQFASVASHDLKEPLRTVASYTQLLADRYSDQLDAEAREYIQFAVNGVSRMQSLIEDLLTYSRVGAHPRPLVPVETAPVVAGVLANLHAIVTQGGAQIEVGALPAVMGDAGQLAQLFQNLISNALKFHRDGPPQVWINAQAQGSEWLFSVRDAGIGLDMKYADRIFLVFQRLHQRSEYPGTGIGLAICKKIVEYHGGRIWVESTPEKGATFWLTLGRPPKPGE